MEKLKCGFSEFPRLNIEAFDRHAQDYDEWFDEHPSLFYSELEALRQAIPYGKKAIEIGVGTGRFAEALEIPIGIEPSLHMAELAVSRGIRVIGGVAENLPLPDMEFELTLMITTVCFLCDLSAAFSECHRVLAPKGEIVIGLIDKNSSLGQKYESGKAANRFYKSAHFYSTEEITTLLSDAGFGQFQYWQTLSGPETNTVQAVRSGYGTGSFVVIKAIKK
jgi:SAM-dependent methyltransferase